MTDLESEGLAPQSGITKSVVISTLETILTFWGYDIALEEMLTVQSYPDVFTDDTPD